VGGVCDSIHASQKEKTRKYMGTDARRGMSAARARGTIAEELVGPSRRFSNFSAFWGQCHANRTRPDAGVMGKMLGGPDRDSRGAVISP
jgi:hypothetical protein